MFHTIQGTIICGSSMHACGVTIAGPCHESRHVSHLWRIQGRGGGGGGGHSTPPTHTHTHTHSYLAFPPLTIFTHSTFVLGRPHSNNENPGSALHTIQGTIFCASSMHACFVTIAGPCHESRHVSHHKECCCIHSLLDFQMCTPPLSPCLINQQGIIESYRAE